MRSADPPTPRLDMRGESASSGSRLTTRPTLSRMSLAASSMSRLMSNSMLTVDTPSALVDSTVLSPSMLETLPSMICVILDSTTLADAPL